MRYWAMLPALCFFLLAHLHIGCRVAVNGQRTEGLYSPLNVARAKEAVEALYEELCPDDTPLPCLQYSYRLCLRPPVGSVEELSRQIIAFSGEIGAAKLISVNGKRLGYVENAAVLKERLHEYAFTHMPSRAKTCTLSYPMKFEGVYARRCMLCSPGEMLNSILQASPLIYLCEDSS